MAMYEEYQNGVLVLRWNEVAKTIETIKADGTVDVSTPMTPEQTAKANAWIADAAARTELAAAQEAVKLIVTDLQAEKARVQPIIDKANNQITAADTKDVARAAKRIADAAIDLAKVVKELS